MTTEYRIDDRPRPGKWASVALSIAMHALLIGLLVYGIRWQTRHEAVSVDLVNSLPPLAAQKPPATPEPPVTATEPAPKPEPKPEPRLEPKPEPKPEPKAEPKPEPRPAPPKPDIALKEKAEKADKPKPLPKEEPKPAQDATRLMQEQLKRETEQLDRERQAQEAAREEALARETQQAAARSRALAAWTDRIRAKIRGNIVRPPALKGNPEAVFEVTQLPTGEVLEVRLKRSSGVPTWDEATERAIHKSSPLPRPEQVELFVRVIELKFKPQED